MSTETSKRTTTTNNNNFNNINFFDRYYKKGWDSQDVKTQARGGPAATTAVVGNNGHQGPGGAGSSVGQLPDFLRFAVPMKLSQPMQRRKMDLVHDGYARYSRA